MTGVCDTAASNLATCLLLEERARAFREDPGVCRALAGGQVDGLAIPARLAGENALSPLRDPGAGDRDGFVAARSGGCRFAHLGQLAIGHLLGAR
jgi:xylose isomerase